MLIRISILSLALVVFFSPAFGQEQLSTTTGLTSNESPGIFSSTERYQPNQFLVGGESPSQIWGSTNFTDGLTAIVSTPSTSSVYQSNAINGFVDNYSTTTAGVAGYFTARCSAGGTECWGINPQVTDRNDNGPLTGIIMNGEEDDVNVVNQGTQVRGILVVGNFFSQPTSAWAVEISASQSGNRWKQGFTTDDGAIVPGGSGLSLGSINAAANSYSQILSLQGRDAYNAPHDAYLQATPSGGLNFSAAVSTFFGFYNAPIGLNTLAASTSNQACLNGSTWNGVYLIAMCSSLRKYKKHIEPLRNGLAEVMMLKPVEYLSKTSGNEEAGFIAEDVEKVDKRFSTYYHGKLIGVEYDHMVALLTKAVQEQQVQIEDLQRQIRALKSHR